MNIENMNMAQVEARLAEIRTAITAEDADIDALDAEVDALEARKQAIIAETEKRNATIAKLNAGAGNVTETHENEETRMPNYNVDSPEYRNAWLKDLAQASHINLGEMTAEEREAFTFTTSNSGNVVPTVIANRIVELVESNSPMYNDATKSGMSQGFAIPRHTAINQGDATTTNEGVANDDEQDTFDQLTLSGVEIKKHCVISRKMKFKSISAFEDWVVSHIAARIAVAKDAVIVSRLDDATYGIAAANVLTSQTYAEATIRAIFAKIRGNGVKKVYANSNTIWNGLAGIKIDNKLAFVPSAMENPLEVGRLFGAVVVEDNNLSDNVAYFGIPSKILANDYDELTMQASRDPKTFEDIIAGYSLFDAGLENPKSFVKATFTAG